MTTSETANTGHSDSELPAKDKAALLRNIEQRRTNLGETVDALSSKLDVKARATARARSVVDDTRRTVRSYPKATAGAGVGLLTFLLFIRKVRRP